jgi:hypothetical protein
MESSLLRPVMLDSNDINKDVGEEEIYVKRFDSLPINIERPCLVKLDVEGAEDRVLEGMGERLNEVDFVLIEQIHIKKFAEEILTSKCIKVLEDHGFTSFIQIGTTYYPSGFPSKSDLLFLRPRARDVRYLKNLK